MWNHNLSHFSSYISFLEIIVFLYFYFLERKHKQSLTRDKNSKLFSLCDLDYLGTQLVPRVWYPNFHVHCCYYVGYLCPLWVHILCINGWTYGKFLRKHVSEDKVHWKVLCWFVWITIDHESNWNKLSRSRKELTTKGSNRIVEISKRTTYEGFD